MTTPTPTEIESTRGWMREHHPATEIADEIAKILCRSEAGDLSALEHACIGELLREAAELHEKAAGIVLPARQEDRLALSQRQLVPGFLRERGDDSRARGDESSGLAALGERYREAAILAATADVIDGKPLPVATTGTTMLAATPHFLRDTAAGIDAAHDMGMPRAAHESARKRMAVLLTAAEELDSMSRWGGRERSEFFASWAYLKSPHRVLLDGVARRLLAGGSHPFDSIRHNIRRVFIERDDVGDIEIRCCLERIGAVETVGFWGFGPAAAGGG